MNKPSGPSEPPHDGEEAASTEYERVQGIERSKKPLDDLYQPFLPDPSDETSAEPSGGGYGAAMPPDDSSPPAVIPPTPNPPAEPDRPGAYKRVTKAETAAGKIGVAVNKIVLAAAAVRKQKKDDEVRAAAEAARNEALKDANNQPPQKP